MFHCFTVSLKIKHIHIVITFVSHVVAHVFSCVAEHRASSETVKQRNIRLSDLRKQCVSRLAGLPRSVKQTYGIAMSAPLSSGEPRRSEFAHGRGLSVHPESDAQSIRKLPFKTESDKHDGSAAYRAQLRSDPTNAAEDLSTMPFVKGNPDMFGPSLPLVREGKYEPPASFPQPVIRYGVDRQD